MTLKESVSPATPGPEAHRQFYPALTAPARQGIYAGAAIRLVLKQAVLGAAFGAVGGFIYGIYLEWLPIVMLLGGVLGGAAEFFDQALYRERAEGTNKHLAASRMVIAYTVLCLALVGTIILSMIR